MQTREQLLEDLKNTLARYGYSEISMRKLADDVGITQSTIYHYFPSKESLIKAGWPYYANELDKRREKLPEQDDLYSALKQLIRFRFDNAAEIVFMAKYFYQYREDFEKNSLGYSGRGSYHDIQKILDQAVIRGELEKMDTPKCAKMIMRLVNAYVLEYFPDIPKKTELDGLVKDLTNFSYSAITNKELVYAKKFPA